MKHLLFFLFIPGLQLTSFLCSAILLLPLYLSSNNI